VVHAAADFGTGVEGDADFELGRRMGSEDHENLVGKCQA